MMGYIASTVEVAGEWDKGKELEGIGYWKRRKV